MFSPRRGLVGMGGSRWFWALAILSSAATANECNRYTVEASRIVLKLPIASRTPIDAGYFSKSPPRLSQASREVQPEQFELNGNLLEAIFCSYDILPGKQTVVALGPKKMLFEAKQVSLQGTDISGRKTIEVIGTERVTIDWPTIRDAYIHWPIDNEGLNIELQFHAFVLGDLRTGKIAVLIERRETVCRAGNRLTRDLLPAHMVPILVSVNSGPKLLREAKYYEGVHCGPSEALLFELADTEITATNGKMSLQVALQQTDAPSASSAAALRLAVALLARSRHQAHNALHARVTFDGGNLYPQRRDLTWR